MKLNSKIYVAGHNGLVGSAILKKLKIDGFSNLITRSHSELDLMNQNEVKLFFEEKPEYVFLAAAKVGGILANKTYPADFIYNNSMIQNNIIHYSWLNNVKKLLFLGSSCIYPRNCPQPMKEKHLMSGYLEKTNSAYAVAKISGIEMCWSYNKQHNTKFIPVMPTNLYGENDNFDLETSHVLPALIRKFHDAKNKNEDIVTIWGTGKPKREFIYVDDMAEACIFVMKNAELIMENNPEPLLNIGTGEEISIMKLANLIKNIVGFKGQIKIDSSKPDGTPLKRLNVNKLKSYGWNAKTRLEEGILKTYDWYIDNIEC